MTRKDSTFNTHWDRGFEIIYSNGRYKQLCDSVTTKHPGRYIRLDRRPWGLLGLLQPDPNKFLLRINPYPFLPSNFFSAFQLTNTMKHIFWENNPKTTKKWYYTFLSILFFRDGYRRQIIFFIRWNGRYKKLCDSVSTKHPGRYISVYLKHR